MPAGKGPPMSSMRRSSQTSTASSLDEILSTSPPEGETTRERALVPQVVTADDRRRQKEEETRKSLRQHGSRDPYTDPDLLGRFVAEVEKFSKLVDGLTKETLSKYTPLEREFKVSGNNKISSTLILIHDKHA